MFTVEMTKALAWPVGAVALASVFKSQIEALMGRLEHLKASGVQVDFGAKIAEVAESLPADIDQHKVVAKTAQARINTNAKPEDVIFEAWRQLETKLRKVSDDRRLGDGRGRFKDALTIAARLPLAPGMLGTIKRLHSIRNDAVHATSRQPTFREALEYVGLVAEVMQSLNETLGQPIETGKLPVSA